MNLSILYLLSIGFITGLSGAMIPGPLLAFTIADSIKKGSKAGFIIILGHALVEIFIIAFLFIGIGKFIGYIETPVYLLGGAFLILMSFSMLKDRDKEIDIENNFTQGSFLGGVSFTLFNPGVPLWWATIGYALLLQGLNVLGSLGVALVTIGHWFADFGYYCFVSYLVAKGKKILTKRYKLVIIILAGFLLILGIHFLTKALVRIL